MLLENTTAIDNSICVKMTELAVKFWAKNLGVPFKKSHIKKAHFRNRHEGTSGRAWWSFGGGISINRSRFCVSVGHRHWTCGENCQRWCGKSLHVGKNNLRNGDHAKCGFKYVNSDDIERIRQAFRVAAHEVGHLAVHYAEDFHGRPFTRNNGKSGGGDEEFIDRTAWKFVDQHWAAFRLKVDKINSKIAEKKKAAEARANAAKETRELSIAAKQAAPKLSLVERREQRAIKLVERTQDRIKKLERLMVAAQKRLKAHKQKVKYYEKRKVKK